MTDNMSIHRGEGQPQSALRRRHRTPWQLATHRFRQRKVALWGLSVLIVLATMALFAESIAPYDPNAIDLAGGTAGGRPLPPSRLHWMGTDQLGRDHFSRVVYGARVSLSVGFIAMGIAISTGTLLGGVAGYFGGWTDSLIMRATDVMLSIPQFFLILTVQSLTRPSIYNVMAVIGLTGWAAIARVVRAEVLSIRAREHVLAARSIGAPSGRIILRHLLPNALGPIIVAASLHVPSAILTESGLSFVGLGVQPPQASWGNMLQGSTKYLGTAWWMVFWPGLFISLAVTSFNFAADGLRDALDPRSLP
jgi:peptide/nickel transport system permease protein